MSIHCDRFKLHRGRCLDLLKQIPDSSIDLILTSPPYCMRKEYDTGKEVDDFVATHQLILPEAVRVLKDTGSVCWQVGYHVQSHVVTPLDFLVYDIMSRIEGVRLRDRIIWTFGHGLHSKRKFSGRHETILWFSKTNDYFFDLDPVRIWQKYPGKRSYKGINKGEYSGNPKGKNPTNVWDIPNVNAGHVEKTPHPCQFPVALAERIVLSLSPKGGEVLDPFAGSGTTGVAAMLHGRRFIGAESDEAYHKIAQSRINSAIEGTIQYRPAERTLYEPPPDSELLRNPFISEETNRV